MIETESILLDNQFKYIQKAVSLDWYNIIKSASSPSSAQFLHGEMIVNDRNNRAAELLLQDHPYASLYAPTLLNVEPQPHTRPHTQPQPVETPSSDYDAATTTTSRSDRKVRPIEETTRTKNIRSVKKEGELKRKLPQPIETPSFVLYASGIQKSASATASHTPQKSVELVQNKNDNTSGVMAKRQANHQKLLCNDESSTISNTSKSVNSSNHETNRPETNEPARKITKLLRPRNEQQPSTLTPTPKPGISKSVSNLQWRAFFERLVCYKTEHETSFVPRNDKTYPMLAVWVHTQIQNYNMGTLIKEHEHLLVSIGFDFHEFRKRSIETWEAMFQRYNAHRKIYKDVGVFRVAARDPGLGNWMKNQRALNKKGILETTRKRRMDDVGFDWNVRSWDSWDEMFRRLKVFWVQNGTCNVSRSKGNDNKLANWVIIQRSRLLKHTISEEQIESLNMIDFDWRASMVTKVGENDKGGQKYSCPVWEAMYERYKYYNTKHDPVITSEVNKADRKLANWMKNQKLAFNNGVMEADRIQRLKQIGFDFPIPLSHKWKGNFTKLETFWKQYGHTKVKQSDDPQLSAWVRTQRQRANSGTILEDRVRMLDTLEFHWKIYTKGGRTPGSKSKSNDVRLQK